MSNQRFTFADAATVQRAVRIAIRSGGLTVAQSYEICSQVLQAREYQRDLAGYLEKAAAVRAKEKSEPVLRRPPCLEHREKSFTFKDGSVMMACTHTSCGWGKNGKTHSDGGTLDIDVESVEVDSDDPIELLPPKHRPEAGEDEVDEVEDEVEAEVEDEVEVV